MPFQQRTNTSCYLAIPTHGFTVVLSVFRGTPPAKPLKCKSVSNRLGARFRQRPRTLSGPVKSLGLPAPEFVWCCRTSSRRHFLSSHSALPFVIKFRFCFGFRMGNKKPCFLPVSRGVEILYLIRLPAYLCSIGVIPSLMSWACR